MAQPDSSGLREVGNCLTTVRGRAYLLALEFKRIAPASPMHAQRLNELLVQIDRLMAAVRQLEDELIDGDAPRLHQHG